MKAPAVLALAALLWGAPAFAQAGDHAADPEQDPVVRDLRAATARFRDQAVAEAEGYRRIGPDIPAMGEHWVQVSLLLDPSVDVTRPEILSYVPVDGEPRLAGVGWAVPLFGDEEPPPVPGLPAHWHAHGGPIEEELLQVDHAHHGLGSGSRVAVIHAWTWIDNPAGTYEPDNWALPALRLGLPPEDERNDDAARALSLARGGDAFLARQVSLLARLDPPRSAQAERILADAGATVDGIVAGMGPAGLTPQERARLAAAWRDAGGRIARDAGPGTPVVRDVFGLAPEPGRRCGWVCGAAIGGGAGAATGLLLANAQGGVQFSTLLVASIPTLIGAGIGAVVGSR